MDLAPGIVTRDRSILFDAIGGFLVLQTPDAGGICRFLYEHGLHSDFRGNSLRLGPAPYLSDEQLTDALSILCLLRDQTSEG